MPSLLLLLLPLDAILECFESYDIWVTFTFSVGIDLILISKRRRYVRRASLCRTTDTSKCLKRYSIISNTHMSNLVTLNLMLNTGLAP